MIHVSAAKPPNFGVRLGRQVIKFDACIASRMPFAFESGLRRNAGFKLSAHGQSMATNP
jgi:hypothetical protein